MPNRSPWPFILFMLMAPSAFGEEAVISVDADRILGPISRYLTGACIEDVNHEIYGGT